jgi:nucleotide-binding universal stress UspA family protein
VLHVLEPEPNRRYRPAGEWNREREEAFGVVEKLAVIARRLGVRVAERIAEGRSAGEVILGELDREPYQLVALGGVDRGSEDRPYLGRTIQTVLTEGHTPSILLVSHLT